MNSARPARFVAGRRVLVTGAGGSIGSELCRQIATAGRVLVLLGHGENSIFEAHVGCARPFRRVKFETVIADIRDTEPYLPGLRPHAARDRVPCGGAQARAADGREPRGGDHEQCHRHPEHGRSGSAAAVRAVRSDLDRQGCRPTSIMGASKRVAELLVRAAAQATATVRRRALRQRARQPRQRRATVQAADREQAGPFTSPIRT